MTKRPRMRLSVMLVLCTLLSLALALGTCTAAHLLAGYLIDEVYCTPVQVQAQERVIFSDFLLYLNQNQIDIADTVSIQQWVKQKRDLMIVVYDATKTTLTPSREGVLYATVSDGQTMYELLQDTYADYWFSAQVTASSTPWQTRKVKIMYFPMYRWEQVGEYLSISLGMLTFIGALFVSIHGKTRYIGELSRALTVMQGGDLSHPMTIRGNDELTTLAMDIDEMRKSFIERLEAEEAMRCNNSNLLTAMSHDLRTPLTSLIGYLDIIDLGRYTRPEQLTQFIHSSKLKAYQIKEMTDKLFEYFLVYSTEDEAFPMEDMDAPTLIGQLIEESAFMLENEGFSIEWPSADAPAEIRVNPLFLRRVFDNVFSNVRKYADRAQPVSILIGTEGDHYAVTVTNQIAPMNARAESSGIGIKTCQKIMSRFNGTFETTSRQNTFTCRLTFPILASDEIKGGRTP